MTHNELNKTEKMLLDLLAEKEHNLMTAFGEQVAVFHRQLEERMGLETGAIGTTYQLDPENAALVEIEDS